ncbi:hypothetical protein SAMN05421803_105271 [Nocardiopsis flavescens]|uniref:Uncharacterized protein n=1 Tax=Nocardiopsis flavescens TaxID=758803 RepID=A0A1M6IRS5_9ACTN|nr:hypothetical protein SAMN05421803_105271 [Nocardiopsis flavescens]
MALVEPGHATTHFNQDTYHSVHPDVAKRQRTVTTAMLRGETVSVG